MSQYIEEGYHSKESYSNQNSTNAVGHLGMVEVNIELMIEFDARS